MMTQIPFRQYLQIDAMSASRLKKWRESALIGAAYEEEKDAPASRALRLGHAVHARLEDPEDYQRRAVTYKGLRPGSGIRKFEEAEEATRARAEIESEVRGEPPTEYIVLAEEWAELIEGMAEAIERHKVARSLMLAQCEREVTVTWDDPDLGVPCKARLDGLLRRVGCWDWKSCSDFSARGIERAIERFGYHLQAAWYIRAMRYGLGIEWPTFEFVFVGTTGPSAEVAVINMPEQHVTQGWAEALIAFDAWKNWKRTHIAPFTWEDEVSIGLPSWAEQPSLVPRIPLLGESE